MSEQKQLHIPLILSNNAPKKIDINLKLQRFAHPSHKHKLFQNIVRNMSIFCDNLNCKRKILNNEVSFVCFRCNYDLCARCYFLPTEETSVEMLSDSDEHVNEDVLFMPERYPARAKSVKIYKQNNCYPNASVRVSNNQHSSQSTDTTQKNSNSNENDNEYDDEDEDVDDDTFERCESSDPCDSYEEMHDAKNNNNIENINESIGIINNDNNDESGGFGGNGNDDDEDDEAEFIANLHPQPSITYRQGLRQGLTGTLTFESTDYDDLTTRTVNQLLDQVSDSVHVISIPNSSIIPISNQSTQSTQLMPEHNLSTLFPVQSPTLNPNPNSNLNPTSSSSQSERSRRSTRLNRNS